MKNMAKTIHTQQKQIDKSFVILFQFECYGIHCVSLLHALLMFFACKKNQEFIPKKIHKKFTCTVNICKLYIF